MNPVPFTTLAAAMDFVVGDRNYPLSELFMKGGFIMWPLLLLSIAGVVVLVMCCFLPELPPSCLPNWWNRRNLSFANGITRDFPSSARMEIPATLA